MNTELNRPAVIVGLAFMAGLGLILMVIALAMGVIEGEAANMNTVNMTFLAGLVLLVSGIAGWIAVAQPHRHFDNINVPQDDGHHGHDAEEHALVVTHPDDHTLVESKH